MKIINLIISFLLSFSACACSVQQDVNQSSETEEIKNAATVRVYFTKSEEPDGISLVSVKRKVPKDENILDSTLRELFLGPTKKEALLGVMTEIPTGTRLIKITESEDDILLDISSQYLVGGGSASVQLRYLQLYNTIKQVEPHKKFYLHVDGKSIKTIAGEGLEVAQPLSTIDDYTKKFKRSDELQP